MRSTPLRCTDGPDLAAGTVTGSLPGSAAETDATNQLTATSSVPIVSYALVTGGNAATAGHLRHHPGQHRRHLHLHADQRRSTPRRTPTTAPTPRWRRASPMWRRTPTATPRPAPSRSTSSTTFRRRWPTSTAGSRARIVTGNVLTDGTADVFGADGARRRCRRGGVVGVRGGQRHLFAGV